jgi:hypothetical protein
MVERSWSFAQHISESEMMAVDQKVLKISVGCDSKLKMTAMGEESSRPLEQH